MVRISHERLIELLRGALRAAELEVENQQLAAATAHLNATTRASELLLERDPGFELDHDALQNDPPVSRDGSLHEAAFAALVDQELWAARTRVMEQWKSQTPKET